MDCPEVLEDWVGTAIDNEVRSLSSLDARVLTSITKCTSVVRLLVPSCIY